MNNLFLLFYPPQPHSQARILIYWKRSTSLLHLESRLYGTINEAMDLASPADFAGADDIIANLVKEREPWIRSSNALPNL